jgi:hypothetical protein
MVGQRGQGLDHRSQLLCEKHRLRVVAIHRQPRVAARAVCGHVFHGPLPEQALHIRLCGWPIPTDVRADAFDQLAGHLELAIADAAPAKVRDIVGGELEVGEVVERRRRTNLPGEFEGATALEILDVVEHRDVLLRGGVDPHSAEDGDFFTGIRLEEFRDWAAV